TVKAIVNVALARGNVGRDGCGLMPIRGHSGVQGGAEMGAYATALPGGQPVDPDHAAALAEQWGFPIPPHHGLTAAEQVEAAERFAWPTNRDLRAEIARVVPAYAGIERLERTGDAIQWGGRHLCAGGDFPTASGRGQFSITDVRPPELAPGTFFVSTRRGKQL